MTPHEWAPQWARLSHFRIASDVDRATLEVEWFAQLKHWHVDAVDAGITQLIGGAKDNFLPGLGLLKDHIQARLGRYQRTPGQCGTCHGSAWIEAPPFKSNGLVYANALRRCPDCGIPEPTADVNQRREPLTDLQAHEYAAGRYGRDQNESKPWDAAAREQHRATMRAAFAKLRIKLFGNMDDAA